MCIARVYFGKESIPLERNMASDIDRIEYDIWDDGKSEEMRLDHIGKYKSTVGHILAKHCSDIKDQSEDIIYNVSATSKKKLKDLIVKHNNEIFSFMMCPDKVPKSLGVAETIFKRYGVETPLIKGTHPKLFLKDLNLDNSIEPIIDEFDEKLKKMKGNNGLADFMKQMQWMYFQYKHIGEEVLRLETTLYEKIERLDKLHEKIPLITQLDTNDALPELIQSFTKYAQRIYEASHFEENYKDLVLAYKKWNICRQVVSVQGVIHHTTEPQCTICLIEPISSAIVPCGHTFCSSCSKKQNTMCYICRGQIRERIKLYMT